MRPGVNFTNIMYGKCAEKIDHFIHMFKNVLAFLNYVAMDKWFVKLIPGETDDRRVAIVDEFDGPSAFILDPDEDDAGSITGSQFLVRLIPSN